MILNKEASETKGTWEEAVSKIHIGALKERKGENHKNMRAIEGQRH